MDGSTPTRRYRICPSEGNERGSPYDFLAVHPVPDDSPHATNLLDEEVMLVAPQKDGSCSLVELLGAQRGHEKRIQGKT